MQLKGVLGYFFSKNSLEDFELTLRQSGFRGDLERFVRICVVAGAVLLIVGTATMISLGFSEGVVVIGVPALLFAPAGAYYFFHTYKFELRRREIEKLVPDAMMHTSIFPARTPIETIVKEIAENNYGALSEEFRKTEIEMQKGATVEAAIEKMHKRNKSRVLGRALNLLMQGYKSGADMAAVFSEAADDMLETNAILRERAASLLMQKYTLIIAGGFLVPLILGLLVGLVQGLELTGISEFGMGMSESQRAEVMDASLLANVIYIAEYSIIASFFIANQEGDLKRGVLYALAMLPVSFFVYTIAQTLLL